MSQHDEAVEEFLPCHRWACSETCPAALSLPVALTTVEIITSPPRAFESLSLPGSWITVRHSCSSGPVMAHNKPTRKNQTHAKKPQTCYTPCKTSSLSSSLFHFARPVFQALWSLALPLAQPCVWESFCCTLLSLCALCVFMQACTLTAPCIVKFWVPPLTNWLVKRAYSHDSG